MSVRSLLRRLGALVAAALLVAGAIPAQAVGKRSPGPAVRHWRASAAGGRRAPQHWAGGDAGRLRAPSPSSTRGVEGGAVLQPGGGQPVAEAPTMLDAAGQLAGASAAAGLGPVATVRDAFERLYAGARAWNEANVEFLPNGSGPYLWNFRVDLQAPGLIELAGGLPTPAQLAGKTPVYVAFGTGYNPVDDRAFIRNYLVRNATELRGEVPGLELLLVDKEQGRPPDLAADFFGAPVSGSIQDKSLLRQIVAPVLDAVAGRNGIIVGASTVLGGYVQYAPVLQEIVRESGMNPAIPVNPYEAMQAVQLKSLFRAKIDQHAPWQSIPSELLPYPEEFDRVIEAARRDNPPLESDELSVRRRERWWREVGLPLLGPAIARARAVSERLQAASPGRQLVLKPEQSLGKVGIRDELAGPDAAAEAYATIFKEILFYWSQNPGARGAFGLPERPNLVHELRIKGHGEYDVELVINQVGGRVLEVLGFVIGNPLSVRVTKSEMGMTFPAMLSPELAWSLVAGALDSVLAAWHPYIPFGNFHVEKMLDQGTTPIPIEANPRPLGGMYGVPMVHEWAGIDLVREGMRAALRLSATRLERQPERALTIKKAVAPASGVLREVVIAQELRRRPWLEILPPRTDPAESRRASWRKVYDPRDMLMAAGTSNTYLKAWSDPGGTPEQAIERALDAMEKIEFVVRSDRDDPATERRYPALFHEFHPVDAELRFPLPQLGTNAPPEELAEQKRALGAWEGSAEKTMVIIHSMTLSPELAKGVVGLNSYEARDIAEILRAGYDRGLRIVFVTSRPVRKYSIEHLLEGFPQRDKVLERVEFVAVDESGNRPVTAPLAESLLRDENREALERIRRAVAGFERPAAVISFITSRTEWEVGRRLGLPVYGAHPGLGYVGTKHGNRALFRELGLPLAEGVEHVRTMDELQRAIQTIWTKMPLLDSVMLKISDGVSGVGNRRVKLPVWSDDPLERQRRVRDAINAFGDTREGRRFLAWIVRDGAVVEEFLEEMANSPAPSGQGFIYLDGRVELLSTHEQRLTERGEYVGANYLADRSYRKTVEQMTVAVGRRLAELGVVGRYGVDFGALPDGRRGRVIRPVEINVRAGGTTHPFVVAQLLTGARLRNGRLIRADGRPVVYSSNDHSLHPRLKATDVDALLAFLRPRGVLFDHERKVGVKFHLLDAIPSQGNVGYTVIGTSRREVERLEARLQKLLREYVARLGGTP